MKLGMSTWGMGEVPIDVGLKHLSDVGFDGVEITILPGYTTELDTLNPAERKRIRGLCDQHGLTICAVSDHRSLMSENPEGHAENWRRLTAGLYLCTEWASDDEVPVLCTTLGVKTDEWEPKRELILDRVGRLADYAAKVGAPVGLEAHVGSALDTPEKALWLVEQIDSPYMKLNFDISHFDAIGIPTAQSVAMLVPHSPHTHIKDQRGREFLIPGEGDFDYVDYLGEMDKAGYTGFVTVEIGRVVQRRPDYDALATATQSYKVLSEAFDRAGLTR
jgi:sugar phosphate isomerase/epimerase